MNTRKYIDTLNGRLNTVGKNIEAIRKQQKKSRQDISDQLMILGIDLSVIDYELCAIAKILGVTTDLLLEDFKDYLDKI